MLPPMLGLEVPQDAKLQTEAGSCECLVMVFREARYCLVGCDETLIDYESSKHVPIQAVYMEKTTGSGLGGPESWVEQESSGQDDQC